MVMVLKFIFHFSILLLIIVSLFPGSLIGLIIGILFTINIKSIQSFLEYLLGTKLFSEEVYYLSSLPAKISIYEIIIVLLHYFKSLSNNFLIKLGKYLIN